MSPALTANNAWAQISVIWRGITLPDCILRIKNAKQPRKRAEVLASASNVHSWRTPQTTLSEERKMSDQLADARPGKRIRAINHIGDYQIHRIIGTGTQGKVYRASNNKDERLAIKVLSRDLAKEFCCIECFEDNAAAAAELSHPNIVPVHEIGQFEGRYYFTMDYVQARNLRDYIHCMGQLSPEATLSLLKQAAKALDYAYTRNVVHGHLTPGNVLVTNDGTLKLTDFGTAGAHSVHEGEEETHQETTGPDLEKTILEDGLNPCDLEPREDMQSLGVMVFEMLSGRMLDDDKHKLALSEDLIGKVPPEWRPLVTQLAGAKPTIDNPADLLRALDFFEEEHADVDTAPLDVVNDSDTKTFGAPDPEKELQTQNVTFANNARSIESAAFAEAADSGDSSPGDSEQKKLSRIALWLKRIAIAATASSVILLIYGLAFSNRKETNSKEVVAVLAPGQESTIRQQSSPEKPASQQTDARDASLARIDGEAESDEVIEELRAEDKGDEKAEESARDAEPLTEAFETAEKDADIAPTDPLTEVAAAGIPASSSAVNQVAEVTPVWQPYAARMEKLLATRKYEPAIEALAVAATNEALEESAERWKSYLEEGIRFWEQAAKGAHKAAGSEISLTVRAGNGTIEMNGRVEGVNDDALLSITTGGMEFTCNVRELQLDDALGFAKQIEATPELVRGILFMLDLELDEAARIFKETSAGSERASIALGDLSDPAGLARQMVKARRAAGLQVMIASANSKAADGDPEGAAQLLIKEMEQWKGTPEADELQKVIDKLPNPSITPPGESAVKLWQKIEAAAKKEQWKELLVMVKTFEKLHDKSEVMQLNGGELETWKLSADIGLSIDQANRADAALEHSVPSHNPPWVFAVTAGKSNGDIGEALGRQAAGAVVIGKGEYVEQMSIKGKIGTPENPFAILGVPGGKSILSSLKDVRSRPGKDKGTVWIPWMERPPGAALLQGLQPLKATNSAPSEPGSYFIDQKAKRCLIVPYPGEEQPAIRVPVLIGGQALSVDSTPHLLLRDLAFEQPGATINVGAGARSLLLQRITTWQQGAMNIDCDQVMVKDSIITCPVNFQSRRLFASDSVFRSVRLISDEPGSEVVFDNCLILGGVQLTAPNPKRIEFRYCTFIGCSNALDLQSGINVLVVDCIFTGASESAVLLKQAGTGYQIKNVCMWQNGADFGGVAPESPVMAVSPMFRSIALADLRLKKESPCRGKASNKKDIGLNWSDTQWGRWFRFLKTHYATGILGNQ